MAFLDELNTYTRRHIAGGVVDNVFKNDPVLAMIKANHSVKFTGGTLIQENFLYAPMQGGSYAQGDSFDITRRQTATGASFDLKHYYVNVTEFKEQIQIFNKGEAAVFRIVDNDLQNAALTMSGILAVDMYQNGQAAARTTKLNGFAEQLGSNTAASFDGTTYSTYGTLSRGGTIGTALNSPMTGPTADIDGPITYKILEEAYNSVVIGPEHPDVMVTTNLGYSYIKEKFQPQWRVESQDPKIGFNSLVFNAARIHQSQYAPGTAGVNDSVLGNYLVSTGETLFYLNTKYLRMYVTDDNEFGFGFTGFKPAQDNTQVAGQYLAALNVTNQSPRLMRHVFDFTG
jgi:hypothetical protein